MKESTEQAEIQGEDQIDHVDGLSIDEEALQSPQEERGFIASSPDEIALVKGAMR